MIEAVLVFIILLVACIAAYKEKSLSLSGAVAALIIGIAVYLGFGVKGLLLLGVFFATSTFWSKYKSSAKQIIEEKLAKGATRDWRQVIANGGAAALYSILYYIEPAPILSVGFAVALASANSDTWASEIGSLSKQNPLYIRTFKPVEKGTSGAVSSLGSIAAVLGSLLIAIISIWFFKINILAGFIIFLCGFLGNVIDTVFGAYYQQLFVCTNCHIETEKRAHCGQPTKRIKGFSFVDNDMVNFLSGFIASIIAIGLFYFLHQL